MSRFGVLKPPPSPAATAPAQTKAPAETAAPEQVKPVRQDRANKKMVGGYYTTELSRAVNILAAEQETTVQALVGEALDLLLRHYGKHPMGER